MFGQTDHVPGLFYIHTRFFHVDFCPLCPTQSYLVLELQGEANRAIEIPTHGKSVAVAWLRFFSVLFFVVAIIIAVAATIDDSMNASQKIGYYIPILPTLLFVIFAMVSKLIQNASYESATELCAGLGPELGPRLQGAVNRKFNRSGGVIMADAIPLDEDEEVDGFQDEEAVEIIEIEQKLPSKTEDVPIISFSWFPVQV